ncbi:MAG: hypothetical protein HC890_05525 [Chloroflexaceae bacterium]|nr:hypothetical protein [Chloroflexaceae bacterium]
MGQSDATLSDGETRLARLKAASEAHKQYRFSRRAVTTQRRAAFRSLYDGVNRINRIGQLVYGPTSPQGQLFRNHWQFRRARRRSPALPTSLTD